MRCAITAPRSAGAAAVVCTLLALTPTLDAQQSPQSADAAWHAAFDRDVEYLSALEPRAEDATADLHAAEYIQRRLSAMGLSPQLRFLHDPLSATVEAVVPGALPDSLMVAVPLAPPAAAPGDPIAAWRRRVEPTVSGIAPAVALGFARSLAGATLPPPITVRFLFLGAEHGPAEQGYPVGSRKFLQEFQVGAPVAVLYLDLRGIPSHLVPYAGGAGIASPPWLFDRVVTALQAAGNPLRLTRANTIHLVRLGLTTQSLLAPFHQAGLPGLQLAGQYRPVDDSESLLWPDRMQEFLALLLASFADGVPDDWGRHYLLFNRPRSPLIVTEPDYMIALILVLGLAITYLFAVSSRLRFFLAPLWRDLWRIPLLAAVTFAAISAGTVAVRLLPMLRGTPTLWHEAPLLFVTLKVAVALLTAALLRYVAAARWLPQPRRQPVARFDWAAAVVLLFALSAGAAAFNIALAFPLVWALMCALLATTSHNPWIRLLWILPAPLWIVAPARGLLTLPALPFVELVLFASPGIDLLATAAVLPFWLLWRGALGGLRRNGRRRPGYGRRVALHAWTATLAVLIVAGSAHALTMNLYGVGGLQPLAARASIDLDTGRGNLHLSSPGPIGAVTVNMAGEERTVTTREQVFTVPMATVTGLMTFAERSETYRDRYSVTLDLAPLGQPRELRLTLESDDAFALLGASHRYLKLDQGRYQLLVGLGPPNPLPVQLTVPRDLKLVLRFDWMYDQPPVPLTVQGNDRIVVTSTRVTGSIPISS